MFSETPGRHHQRRVTVTFCGGTAFLVGAVVLFGWMADIPVVTYIVPGLASMKANTALSFVLAGFSLWAFGRGDSVTALRTAGLFSSVVVLGISGLTLTEYAFGINLGIDQLLVRETTEAVATPNPGRMALITALEFLLISVTLLLLRTGHPGVLGQSLTGLVTLISAFSGLCYLLDTHSLQDASLFATMAVHTVATFLVLSVGLISALPAEGIVGLAVSESPAGMLIRRLVPATIIVSVLLAALRLAGQRAGWYGAEFGVALLTISFITACTALIGWAAVRTQHAEAQRAASDVAMRQSERRFRSVVEASSAGLVLVNQEGRITLANSPMEQLFGYNRDELLELPLEQLIPKRFREGHPGNRSRYAADPQPRLMGSGRDLQALRKDGSEFPVEVGLRPLELDDGSFVLASIIDISARKRDEAELRHLNANLEQRVAERTELIREQEERFRSAFEDAPIGVAQAELDGRFCRVNRAFCELLGYSEQELLAATFQSITHPDDLDVDLEHSRALLTGVMQSYCLEKRFTHKSGHAIFSLLSVSLVRDSKGAPLYTIKQIQDITERKRAEQQTEASLREKEVMLKEIHHRVKNNLQIVSTLLDLQSEHTSDSAALEMFQESRSRVKSMALIHERLYRSQDLAGVDFGEYVRQLADDLYRTYKVSDEEIQFVLTVDVPPVPVDVAIPCGLLLNELMSNCFKHAFAGRKEGTLSVSLLQDTDDDNVLVVSDDGAGFPVGMDFRNTPSFGLQLVITLVEQLRGEISLSSEGGSTFTVRFPGGRI